MKVSLPYAGIAIGETVPIAISLENKSIDRKINKTEIKLKESVVESGFGITAPYDSKWLINESIETPVRTGHVETFNYNLKIPENAQNSDFLFTERIQMMHAIIVKAAGMKVFIPIVIGTQRARSSGQLRDICAADNEALVRIFYKFKSILWFSFSSFAADWIFGKGKILQSILCLPKLRILVNLRCEIQAKNFEINA